MKIRLGFISNSSSCTFVAVLPQSKYDKIIKELSKDYKPYKSMLNISPIAEEEDLVLVSCGYNEDQVFINDEYYEYDEDGNRPDLIRAMIDKLSKATKLYYSEER